MTDPIVLSAQARPMLQKLHGKDDIVVRFKTDQSGYDFDKITDDDMEDVNGEKVAAPGHFRTDKNVLTLNLDRLVTGRKPTPTSLSTIEDWRKYPILTGVAAHESGHARWSRYDNEDFPEAIPNPNYDPAHENPKMPNPAFQTTVAPDPMDNPETIDDPDYAGPEWFPVSGNGELLKIAEFLEEPRIERLGTANYTKTWKAGMTFSAGHFITEKVAEMDADGVDALDSAVRLAILVGGRQAAGTLGLSTDSHKSVKKILDSAEKIIEAAVANFEKPTPDPFHKIMGIISKEVFNNDHEDATSHLEAARQIQAIIHPETQNDPDQDPSEAGGDDEADGGGFSEGAGAGLSGVADPDGSLAAAMGEMKAEVAAMAQGIREESYEEADEPGAKEQRESGGHGATVYRNQNAPQTAREEDPNDEDKALYRRARAWMEKQIENTIIESEISTWLPSGGARLNVRNHIRDNMAGNKAMKRHDWDRVSETIKPAPPVKVAIMLDGSGSMARYARLSASIAWAASNAAADLPESRTVSVVYGSAAQMTQAPGHTPAKKIAVSNTNGSWENWIHAAQIVEDELELGPIDEEDEKSNTLIIVVSDLMYGRTGQGPAFTAKTAQWAAEGARIVVVGPEKSEEDRAHWGVSTKNVELVTADALFRD